MLALLFTFIQISIALMMAPGGSEPLSKYLKVNPPPGWIDDVQSKSVLARKYQRLNNWDSLRYFDIAKNGYHTPPIETVNAGDIENFKSNISFFPGYPILSRITSKLFDIPIQMGLLFTTHLATFIFWLYFFSLLKLWKISQNNTLKAGVLILSFPTSFYLVMGYSESLFLACMLGFIYWFEKSLISKSKASSIIAGLHGFVMSATRLMAMPLLLYPTFRFEFFTPLKKNTLIFKSALIFLISILGCLTFFAFCQIKFGHWNLYMLTDHIGWNVVPQPFAIFNPLNYLPRFFFENTEMSLDRSIPLMILLGLIWLWKKDSEIQKRVGLYASLISMHYLLITAKSGCDQIGMARHGFTPFILLTLAWTQIHAQLPNTGLLHSKSQSILYKTTVLIFFTLQCYLTHRFVHGKWVE